MKVTALLGYIDIVHIQLTTTSVSIIEDTALLIIEAPAVSFVCPEVVVWFSVNKHSNTVTVVMLSL